MTLLQIRYASECQHSRSISAASEALFTTISNVSKNLKSLEEELGFSLFVRSPHGLLPTPQGQIALDHFQTILKECDEIRSISSGHQRHSFVLASLPIYYSFDAFSRLAAEHPDDSVGLKFHSTGSIRALDRLRNHLCDAALVGCIRGHESQEIYKYKKLGILLEPVRTTRLAFYLSMDHPLVRSGLTHEQILNELIRYPYVEYNDDIYLTQSPTRPFIDPDHIIKVNDRDWRFSLLGKSDCYSSGIYSEIVARNHPTVYQVPLPDVEIVLLYAVREGEKEMPPVCRYRELIRE